MNLAELYEKTPIARHKDIKVSGDKVFVKDTNGSVDEYLVVDNGELWLVRSDREVKRDVKAIRDRLGA